MTKEIIKLIWEYLPVRFIITLIARLLIAGVVLEYIIPKESFEISKIIIPTVIMMSWVLIPVYNRIVYAFEKYKFNSRKE